MSPPVKYIADGNTREPDYGFQGPGWYFWDETWAGCHGPHETEAEAEAALARYCEWLEGYDPCNNV